MKTIHLLHISPEISLKFSTIILGESGVLCSAGGKREERSPILI